MTYLEFCKTLKKCDRIVIPISLFFSHHAIFWGWDVNGQGWIIENSKSNGVRFVTIEDFFFGFNGNVNAYAFVGSEDDRNKAMNRAVSVIGTKYHLTNWNCEQFANFVQCNQVQSRQVSNTLLSAIGIGIWFGGRQS